jgi:hypothetical protein
LIEEYSALGQEAPLDPYYSSEFSELQEPLGFSLNLVKWVKERFGMEDGDVVQIVQQRKVCLDSGKCVEPKDVGSNCCLF